MLLSGIRSQVLEPETTSRRVKVTETFYTRRKVDLQMGIADFANTEYTAPPLPDGEYIWQFEAPIELQSGESDDGRQYQYVVLNGRIIGGEHDGRQFTHKIFTTSDYPSRNPAADFFGFLVSAGMAPQLDIAGVTLETAFHPNTMLIVSSQLPGRTVKISVAQKTSSRGTFPRIIKVAPNVAGAATAPLAGQPVPQVPGAASVPPSPAGNVPPPVPNVSSTPNIPRVPPAPVG